MKISIIMTDGWEDILRGEAPAPALLIYWMCLRMLYYVTMCVLLICYITSLLKPELWNLQHTNV